jgi:nuclear pore complex protein Nup62
LSQKRQFFAIFFSENIFKIITSVLDRANFSPIVGLFTLCRFSKISEAAPNVGLFFPPYIPTYVCISHVLILTKKWDGPRFGRFFQKLICSPRMHMYVCMYVCICMYVCMHMYVCMYAYVCMHMYAYVCMHMYVCMYAYVCMYVCMHMYVCMYAYVCMYVCICMHVCMYTFKSRPF